MCCGYYRKKADDKLIEELIKDRKFDGSKNNWSLDTVKHLRKSNEFRGAKKVFEALVKKEDREAIYDKINNFVQNHGHLSYQALKTTLKIGCGQYVDKGEEELGDQRDLISRIQSTMILELKNQKNRSKSEISHRDPEDPKEDDGPEL